MDGIAFGRTVVVCSAPPGFNDCFDLHVSLPGDEMQKFEEAYAALVAGEKIK
jgi:hypothetical protein